MRRRFLRPGLLALVLLAAGLAAGRLHHRLGQLDLGGRDPATLSAATAEFMARFPRRVSATYFVSAQERMPSRLRGMEESVGRLLAALRAQTPDRFAFRLADPQSQAGAGPAQAAGVLASPLSASRVLGDEHRQQQIWSSLVLECEGRPAILLQGLEPGHLPLLQEAIVQHLRAADESPTPVFAVSAPPGFAGLAQHLRQYGEVLQIDLDQQPSIPPEADVLFWIQPGVADAARCRRLQRFVARGRTAILAGSAYAVDCPARADHQLRCQARPLPEAWASLLQSVGLRPLPDLLLDRSAGPALEPAFRLRCLPGLRNMKSFAAPARGMICFDAASALEIDPHRTSQAGFRAEVVATTTEHARVQALPAEEFAPPAPESGLAVGKQNLMVLLKPDDPWQGQVLVLAGATVFQDGFLEHSQYAHALFLRDLVRTFAAPERLVQARVERPAPPSFTLPGPTARLLWRVAVAFLVPAALLGLGTWRYLGAGAHRPAVAIPGRFLWRATAGLGGLIAVLATAATAPWDWGLDLSAEGRNTLSELTRQSLDRHQTELQADLIIGPRAALPAPLKPIESQLRRLFAGRRIRLRVVRPAALAPQEQQALSQQGIRAFPAQRVVQDSLVPEQVWSGLRLRLGTDAACVPRLDQRAYGHLDFLLAAAVARLEQGRAPLVAVAADLPRLSPAEAMEDYQRRNLTPPSGVDVYRQLESLLREYGYQVAYVDPQAPSLPEGTDLVLWLQPRRDSGRFIERLSHYLSGGGKALVTLQHFNIQQRQYRSAGFQTVYWPQPQFQDFDRYLRLTGVEQVREVLMDQTQSHLELDTQVNRGPGREYDPQEVALPFLIRALPARFDPNSVITHHLGDQLFIWGNRFALDRDRLAASGVHCQVLITTSDQAWSYAWQGGFLAPEVFAPSTFLPGPQPLAVLLEGPLPAVELAASQQAGSGLVVVPPPLQARGSLLLVGCSEMFKDPHLHRPGFQHAQLLLNAVAFLTYGPELAELQGRHPPVRGFALDRAASRAGWRLFAAGSGPLLFLLCGLGRWHWRRRSVPRPG